MLTHDYANMNENIQFNCHDMKDNYSKILKENLERLYEKETEKFAANLPGRLEGRNVVFNAFGAKCVISKDKITLDGEVCPPVLGILISLYAQSACPDDSILLPLKAFQEFPNSMPYAGAFRTHTEQFLVPHVDMIKKAVSHILPALNGDQAPAGVDGDFSFMVYPFPKIALCYIFYEADEEFPASVTCLYSSNADRFMPIDGLADVGEYTSRKILELISQ